MGETKQLTKPFTQTFILKSDSPIRKEEKKVVKKNLDEERNKTGHEKIMKTRGLSEKKPDPGQ